MSLTPAPARTIDPRGQRFGAGVSAAVLALAFVLGLPWLVALVGLNLLVSAAFGTRFFLPGRLWPAVRSAFKLGPPAEPEHEYPPRFAQALGGVALAVASLAFLLGATTLGWVFTGAVIALQTLLAATGICIGCRLYFLRWFVPSLFAKLLRRADHFDDKDLPAIQRVG